VEGGNNFRSQGLYASGTFALSIPDATAFILAEIEDASG